MNKFIIIAALVVCAVAEPPVGLNGGEPIEGSNYVNDGLLRRISDILNGGSSGDELRSGGNAGSSRSASPSRSYNSPAQQPEDSYGAPPARSAPQSSYNAPSAQRSNPKPLGRVQLESPELAPVVAAFELDGGTETSRSSGSASYAAPSRNGGPY